MEMCIGVSALVLGIAAHVQVQNDRIINIKISHILILPAIVAISILPRARNGRY